MNAYTGLVATRCGLCEEINTTNRQLMSRSSHVSREAITSLRVAIANWYVPVGSWVETGSGSSATVTASIEYPSGTFTQVTFSGSASGVVSDGATLLSDPVSVTIPDNTPFWVRQYWVSTTGVLINPQDVSGAGTVGDGLEMGVSGITDKTMSGTVSGSDNYCPPVAIIGTTTKPSVVIVGDSIAWGEGDLTGDTTGTFGILGRGLQASYAFTNLAQRGDDTALFIAGSTRRQALFPYASHLICQYGFNDIYGAARSAATVLANQATIRGYMKGLGSEKFAYQTTITPKSTSTDSWATTGNQTADGLNGTRLTVNAGIRGLAYYIELADQVESARDSGKWKVTGSAFGYTADGVHPNTAGYALVRDSGVVGVTEVPPSFPTTPLLDLPNRPDEEPISFNGKWTIGDLTGYTGLKVAANGIKRSTAAAQSGLARWNVQRFGPGSEVYVQRVTEYTSDHDFFFILNMTNPGASYNGYLLYISRGSGAYTWQIYRSDAGTLTQLGANVSSQVISDGDWVGARWKDGAVELWYRPSGGDWVLRGSRSDATYPVGYLALSIGFGDNNTTVMKNFGGGSIGGVVSAAYGDFPKPKLRKQSSGGF